MLPINLCELTNGQQVSGLIYIQSHTRVPNLQGLKYPLDGVASYKGKTVTFKTWDGRIKGLLNSSDFSRTIAHIVGTVGMYRDKLEITLTDINFDHGVTDVSQFFKSVDVESVFGEFKSFLDQNMGTSAYYLLTKVFGESNLYEPFKLEWAGSRMHDAQVGGLMNHTLKMLRLAETLIKNDSRLSEYSDLLYLSIIFHDIGKVRELSFGGYTDNSFVSHRFFGAEMLLPFKNDFVEYFGETFFYHLIAVQLGHHGQFADKPTNVWAWVVHLIDMLESQVTGLLDKIDNLEYKIEHNQKVVWVSSDMPKLVL